MLEFEQTLSQKQIISQKMIQTLSILQMSAQELETHINDLAMENPVLELPPQSTETADPSAELDRQRKLDWLEATDYQNHVYHEDDDDDSDPQANLQDISQEGEDLASYLLSQIINLEVTDSERKLLEYIIYSLDSRGYFTEDPSVAARLFQVPEEKVLRMLKQIQKLDPAGVGARGLKECLLIQIHRTPGFPKEAEAIVLSHLDDVARNHLTAIARALKISPEEVQKACEKIRTLNPKPGNSFSNREHLKYISPDAIVVRTASGFDILINEYQYPKVSVSSFYRDLAQTTDDPEAKKYLSEKIREIDQLKNDIGYRTSTLSKVMHAVVECQYDFFLQGPGSRRPLSLLDLADRTGLSQSTVSRTLRSKYLQCSFGVFPLNYFLMQTVGASGPDGSAVTQEQIQGKIRSLIAAEDPEQPLSDEGIRKKLLAAGISISRRTVNKYRLQLGIPDRSGRKKI